MPVLNHFSANDSFLMFHKEHWIVFIQLKRLLDTALSQISLNLYSPLACVHQLVEEFLSKGSYTRHELLFENACFSRASTWDRVSTDFFLTVYIKYLG